MQGTNQNMGKPTTPAGEEVETGNMAGEISTKITKISNLRDQNSVGKQSELQPRNAIAVGGPDNMQTSAAFALRHCAASARYKATF